MSEPPGAGHPGVLAIPGPPMPGGRSWAGWMRSGRGLNWSRRCCKGGRRTRPARPAAL